MSYVLYVFGKCCEIDEIHKLPSTNTELFEYQIRRHEKKKKTQVIIIMIIANTLCLLLC